MVIVGFATVFLRKKKGGRGWSGTRDGGEAKEGARDTVKLIIVCFVFGFDSQKVLMALVFLIADYPQNSFDKICI